MIQRRSFFMSVAAVLACAVPSLAQTLVRYGDTVVRGSITRALDSHRFYFSGTKGDVLRITFCSQSSCCPTYYYHRLDVAVASAPVGSVVGCGVLTVTLGATGIHAIEVRAQNNQSTGWYAFQINKMNDPVGADRVALNWKLRGTIPSASSFVAYTLRAEAGSKGTLRLTSQSSCCPTYFYHYAELLDATGKRLAIVNGDGAVDVDFNANGIYTLFVAARNLQSTGWFVASLECKSWGTTPCDTVAYQGSYGFGWPGTIGVPQLTASAPKLGRTCSIDVGNSYGQDTTAVVLVGIDAANQTLPAYDGTILVAVSGVLVMPLRAPGDRVSFTIPNDPLFKGIGVAVQALVQDPGASKGVAFSRGLLLLLGL